MFTQYSLPLAIGIDPLRATLPNSATTLNDLIPGYAPFWDETYACPPPTETG